MTIESICDYLNKKIGVNKVPDEIYAEDMPGHRWCLVWDDGKWDLTITHLNDASFYYYAACDNQQTSGMIDFITQLPSNMINTIRNKAFETNNTQ